MNVHASSKNNRHGRVLWVSSFGLIAMLIWASLAELEEIVRGTGKVVPAIHGQIVQNLEGGIIATLLVSEGELVEPGQVIGRLNDARYRSAVNEIEAERVALMLQRLRLGAELAGNEELVIPLDLRERYPEIAQSEQALFDARRTQITGRIVGAHRMADLRQQELAMLEPLAKKNVVSPLDVLKARQLAADAEIELRQARADYQLDVSQQYAKTLKELEQVEHSIQVRLDQLERTVLTSPVRGFINRLPVTTIGGVVKPGEMVAEITPVDDDLRIEAKVSPRDVAFLRSGMPATITLTAFDYAVYGTIDGELLHVSADTLDDGGHQEGEPYYKILVALDESRLRGVNKIVDIRPGMVAEVALHAGKRTVLQYLLKPLFRASRTMTER